MNLVSPGDVLAEGGLEQRHRTALLTLLFTDVVNSVALKETLGDRRALRLLERHDAVLRQLLSDYSEAREAQVAGDSFCLVFPRPSDAVAFALRLQKELRQLSEEEEVQIADRVGIHVGEVLLTEEGPMGRPIGGLQIDTCARLMGIGAGDQILVSRFVFDTARQAFRGNIAADLGTLAWLNHGVYQFKGVREGMEVFEVGEVGVALLSPPSDSAKAFRLTTAEGELVRGWRPAAGVPVPGTSWDLDRCLGHGGFGEVWLATHRVLKEHRVFKFCFQFDRVRSLKRETTLLRILRERAGNHPGMVRIHDVFLDEPPFYLAMDYVEGGSLTEWTIAQGGLQTIPLESRLEIVAQVADALGAAHAAGVVHRDVKPGNVLMDRTPPPTVRAHLSDFGIGQILRDAELSGITQLGFTETIISDSSATGTRMYMAPELLSGGEATVQSDVYALGVLLFQLILGDLHRPVTGDWQEEITDPLLRDDLRKCLASDPARRWASASQVAVQLRALPERRAERQREEERQQAAQRAAYRRGVRRSATVAAAVVAVIGVLAVLAIYQAGRAKRHAEAESVQRDRAETALTRMQLQRADELLRAGDARSGMAYLAHVLRRDPGQRGAAARLLHSICDLAHPRPLTPPLPHPAMVTDVAYRGDGLRIASTGPEGTRVWDAVTGQAVPIEIPYAGYRVAWSPDGKQLAVMRFDLRIFDADTGALLTELKCDPGESRGPARPSFAFAPDWSYVVTMASGDSVEIWNPATGEQLTPPLEHSAKVTVANLHAGQERLITGCEDGSAHLWLVKEGRKLVSVRTPARVVKAVLHPDGRHFFTGSDNGAVQMWDAEGGSSPVAESKHEREIADLSLAPDGATLAVADHAGLCRFYRTADLSAQGAQLNDKFRLWSATYSRDGLRLFTRTGEGLIRIYDSATLKPLMQPLQPDGFPLCAVLDIEESRIVTGCSDGAVQVWDVSMRPAAPLLLPHGFQITDAVFRPGADHLAVAGDDGRVQVWDLNTGAPVGAEIVHGGAVDRLRYDGKGSRLLTIGRDQVARTWDDEGHSTGSGIHVDSRIAAGDFIADRPLVVVTRDGGPAELWDLQTRQQAQLSFGQRAWTVAVNGTGERLLLADDTHAMLYRTGDGQPVGARMSHSAKVAHAIFSPSGQRIATGSYDGSVRVWAAETGAPISAELRHGNVITGLTWSCDDRLLATSCWERAVYLWNATTGQREGAPLIHPDVVTHVAFSPKDPDLLLTGSNDGRVWIWDVRSGQPISAEWEMPGSVRTLGWDSEGSRVFAVPEESDAAYVWAVHRPAGNAQEWLAAWAEATARRALQENGALSDLNFPAVQSLRETLNRAAADDPQARALRWRFSPVEFAKLAPGMPLSRRDYSRQGASSPAAPARHQALLLESADPLVWTEHVIREAERGGTSPQVREPGTLAFHARRALELSGKNSSRAWLALSMALRQQGQAVDARSAVERAIALDPQAAPLHRWLGECAAAAGDWPGAIAAYDRALQLEPTREEARALFRARSDAHRAAGQLDKAGADNLRARDIPARPPDATRQQIDLSAFYNCRLDEDMIPQDRGNTLAEAPYGLVSLAGTTFDVRALVQLGNNGALQRFPREVKGIPVGLTCARLRLLQSAEFASEPRGTTLAHLVIRYADGEETITPQTLGRDLDDWWTQTVAPRLEVAWQGENPLSRSKGRTVSLFRATWENPRPNEPIASLDYVTIAPSAAPFLVAITAE